MHRLIVNLSASQSRKTGLPIRASREAVAHGWQTLLKLAKMKTRILTVGGKSACLSEWAEATGIYKGTIRERLNRGWSVERSLGYV